MSELWVGRQIMWPSGQSISKLLETSVEQGFSAIQIMFGEDPHRLPIRPLNPEDTDKIDATTDIKLVVHGKYLYNSCRSVPQQLQNLLKEIKQADQLNHSNLIIHQGHNVKDLGYTHDQAIHASSNFINTVLSLMKQNNHKNKLLLENSCHEGTALGWNLTDLVEIKKQIDPENLPYLGFCLDTCHAFQAGVCQFKTAAETHEFLESWHLQLNIDTIHLNDSKAPFCSHLDRHGALLSGHIMNPELSGSVEGIIYLIKWAKAHQIMLIMETYPPMEPAPSSWVKDELKLVKDMANDQPYDWYITKYIRPVALPVQPSPPVASDDNQLVVNQLTGRVITKRLAKKMGLIQVSS